MWRSRFTAPAAAKPADERSPAPVSSWRHLSAELDQWQALGHTATLWWRDDDAVTASPALDRLLRLQQDSGVPLALAVIPARVREALACKLEHYPRVAVLQHGYAHNNHAGEGERAIELGGQRRRDKVVEELQQGWQDLGVLFADCLLPVMVPPWNRISAELYPDLHGLGFRALSCFSARSRREAISGLQQSNCHADLVDCAAVEARGHGDDELVVPLRVLPLSDDDSGDGSLNSRGAANSPPRSHRWRVSEHGSPPS